MVLGCESPSDSSEDASAVVDASIHATEDARVDDRLDAGGEVDARVEPDSGEPAGLLGALPDHTLQEESEAVIRIPARAGARVFVHGAPAGAVFDESARELRLYPDFTQGGRVYTVEVLARQGTESANGSFLITIANTIQPPDPVVVSEEPVWQARLLRVALTTDAFLDPPGLAGREFLANVTIPDAAGESMRMPMRVVLHGAGGMIGGSSPGDGTRFGIAPSEPYVSWWTGQHTASPGPATAESTVPNTSQRRILQLIDWVRRTYPGLDTDRIHVEGASMGGSGAFFLGTRYAYHFSHVTGEVNMTAVVVSSSGHRTALAEHWGAESLDLKDDRGMSVWARYDITRALRDDENARNLFYMSVHGVNDSIIPFDHVSTPTRNTGLSWAAAAQEFRAGHRVAWDLRNHSSSEGPPLVGWWYGFLPAESVLRRDLAFPAFTRSSLDQTPHTWNEGTRTFTGGDDRGMQNRFLAWSSASIVDELDRFEIALFVRTTPPATSVGAEYPLSGDGYTGAFPVRADVTPRRIQRFHLLEGEVVHWTFGAESGDVTVDARGDLTIPELPLTGTPTALVLTRME